MTIRSVLAALVSAAIVAGAGVDTASQVSSQSDKQFQSALQKEMIAGDLKGAIEEYRRISTRPGVSRALAAEALLRMAECYEKLGDPEARKVYERILAEFSTETEIAGRARERLSTLQAARAQAQPFESIPVNTRVPRGWVVSPNGHLVAGGDGTGLVLLDLRAGTQKVLVKSTAPQGRAIGHVWSPDGQRIAFLWSVQKGVTISAELRVVEVHSGVVQTIASVPDVRAVATQPGVSPGVLSLLRWSRGNEILCAIGQQEVLVFGPTPGIAPKRIRVPETSQVADVVPDGSALILLDSERLIHLDRATGREQILTRGFPIQQPRVSLDGRLIVYLSNETGQWTLRVAPLTRAEITHSIEIATLPVGVGRARLTQWTADGRLMTEASVATDNIYGMRLEDGRGDARLERLVHNSPYASVPLLSPDDRQIVYHGSGSMNAMQADGSGERPIGPSGVPLSWLSSGELVFWPADNERTLAALDLETSGIRLMGHEIPPNAAAASTALASDSFQYIGFTDELWIRRFVGDRAHFFVRRAGAAERAVMHLPRLTEWRISPQGDRIAYQLRGQQSTGRSGVIHLRTVGADDDKVIGTGGALKWTADGHKLVFRTEGEKAIEFRRYDVTTGQTATVLDARHVDGVFPADSTWNISHCSLATDESFLVCQAMVTTVQRLAWAGVTYDAVIAKLSQR